MVSIRNRVELAQDEVGFERSMQKLTVWVRFLALIHKNNRVWLASHLLRQLAARVMANVSWRRTDQTAHRVSLHVLKKTKSVRNQ